MVLNCIFLQCLQEFTCIRKLYRKVGPSSIFMHQGSQLCFEVGILRALTPSGWNTMQYK